MNEATNEQFVALIIVFSLTTYLIAFSLEKAMIQFKGRIWSAQKGRKRTVTKGDVEAIPIESWPTSGNGSARY
jgi:hypothetical protein